MTKTTSPEFRALCCWDAVTAKIRRARLRWATFVLATFGLTIAGHAADFPGSIVLGRPTGKSITASLLAPSAQTVYLEFGLLTGNYPSQTKETAMTANQPLEVDLTSLLPNTRYYYRVRFRAPNATVFDATPEYSFMTQRAPGSTFIFGAQGDSHPERLRQQWDPTLYARTLSTVAADKPDFYITSGDDFSVDQINQANPRAITQPQVADRYTLQRPYFGILGKSASLFLVNGNHEQAARYILDGTPNNVAVWAQNARNLYYANPAPDDFYSGNSETVQYIGLLRNYYAFTWGDALFVTIDPYWGSPVVVDNDFYGGNKRSDLWDVTHGDAQYQWLKTTLEQSRAKYKFIFAHHVLGTQRGGIDVALKYEWGGQNNNGTPGFATNRPKWLLPIHQLMVANKVTIFFQGHDHIWVHQQLDGVTYQTLSSPANPNYDLFNSDAYATGERFPDSGYTRVTVAPTGVKVEYVRMYMPADEGPGKTSGTVAFSYTIGAGADATPVPVISLQPVSQTVAPGATVTLSVNATSTLPLTYQWKRDGVNVAGGTSPLLVITNVQAANTGSYTAVITNNAGGSVTSTPATLTLGTSKLANLSVRSTAGNGDATLIVGLVVGPGTPAGLLLRGVGPTLGTFGVSDVLDDPVLTLRTGAGAVVATNDDWGTSNGAAQIAGNARQSGAFALPTASRDSAILMNLASGSYTAQVTGKAAATGVALMEAYDTNASPTSGRLVNLSARTQVGTGGSVLIAGFAISGPVPKQLLIRAVGPTLAGFGVGGVLADPQLALFRDGDTTPIQQNDNWLASSNAAQIGLVSGLVGAFALPANSRDAALLVTLPPGTYTAQVSGVGGTTGVALMEIYEAP